ncbi:hypothetical protein LA080_010524 [Diaporthe eres]|nr:hypothetical protein LA080_010524 [Diaporthe eres]
MSRVLGPTSSWRLSCRHCTLGVRNCDILPDKGRPAYAVVPRVDMRGYAGPFYTVLGLDFPFNMTWAARSHPDSRSTRRATCHYCLLVRTVAIYPFMPMLHYQLSTWRVLNYVEGLEPFVCGEVDFAYF